MSKSVLIHMKESAEELLDELKLDFEYSDGELDVIVPDVEYDYSHFLKDPDEQLCEHYGIDYDLVNCIEAM